MIDVSKIPLATFVEANTSRLISTAYIDEPSLAPLANAEDTINKLNDAVDTLDKYKKSLGSLDKYLSKFQDLEYYQGLSCYSSDTGCTDKDAAMLEKNRKTASKAQKTANDAMFKGLDQQQTNLETDATQLEKLQTAAEGAEGQLAAIGYANQFAGNQANQLLQIRSLLIAQQLALGAKAQADLDEAAQRKAADKQALSGADFGKSPEVVW